MTRGWMENIPWKTPSASLVLLIALCACDEGRYEGRIRAAPAMDTLGQTVVVNNTGEGRWREGEEWQAREQWRVGERGLEGESGLWFTNALLGASLGPAGQVCILDFPADALTCLDGDGTEPRTWAERGPGPGELEMPAGMGWDPEGQLWIGGFRGRYTVFDSAGAFLKTVSRPVHGGVRRQYPLVFEDAGTLIEEGLGRGEEVTFLRVDRAGEIIDSLTSLSLTPAGRFPRIVLRPGQTAFRYVLRHYVPATEWAVAPDGTVWTGRTDTLRLYKIDLESGDTLRVVNTVHRTAELTEIDEERIREGLAEVGLDRGEVDFARPVFQSINITSDGFVLVQITDELGTAGRSMDVFDPDGVFMGTVQMPFGLADQSRPAFVGDTVLGVTLGTTDEPYVVRARLLRPNID